MNHWWKRTWLFELYHCRLRPLLVVVVLSRSSILFYFIWFTLPRFGGREEDDTRFPTINQILRRSTIEIQKVPWVGKKEVDHESRLMFCMKNLDRQGRSMCSMGVDWRISRQNGKIASTSNEGLWTLSTCLIKYIFENRPFPSGTNEQDPLLKGKWQREWLILE